MNRDTKISKIDPEWVMRQVSEIAHCKWDYEVAHGMEDDLWKTVLRHISAGTAKDPSKCAHEALKTENIDFARYCA